MAQEITGIRPIRQHKSGHNERFFAQGPESDGLIRAFPDREVEAALGPLRPRARDLMGIPILFAGLASREADA